MIGPACFPCRGDLRWNAAVLTAENETSLVEVSISAQKPTKAERAGLRCLVMTSLKRKF